MGTVARPGAFDGDINFMTFCDVSDGVRRFFPVGFVEINDKNVRVAVFIENILTYDIAESVIVAFEVGDDCYVAQLKKGATATFRTFDSLMAGFRADARFPLVCARWCIADSAVFSAITVGVNIFTTGKEIAEKLEFVACWARAGDDAFDLCSFIEGFAGFLPFFECYVASDRSVVADDNLLSWVRDVVNDFV